jgi:predicted 3-demethylubiquinone-9 3-methyltransferase (glyoxalase superfamily)
MSGIMMTTARPFLMFQDGDAQAALDSYFATFPDSQMIRVERYAAGEAGAEGTIKRFVAIESSGGVKRRGS